MEDCLCVSSEVDKKGKWHFSGKCQCKLMGLHDFNSISHITDNNKMHKNNAAVSCHFIYLFICHCQGGCSTCSNTMNSSIVFLIAKQFIEHSLNSGIGRRIAAFLCSWYQHYLFNLLRKSMTNSSLLLVDSLSDRGKHTLTIHFLRNAFTLAHSCSCPCNSSTKHNAMQIQVKLFS